MRTMTRIPERRQERGFILATVLVFLVVLTLTAFFAARITRTNTQVVNNLQNEEAGVLRRGGRHRRSALQDELEEPRLCFDGHCAGGGNISCNNNAIPLCCTGRPLPRPDHRGLPEPSTAPTRDRPEPDPTRRRKSCCRPRCQHPRGQPGDQPRCAVYCNPWRRASPTRRRAPTPPPSISRRPPISRSTGQMHRARRLGRLRQHDEPGERHVQSFGHPILVQLVEEQPAAGWSRSPRRARCSARTATSSPARRSRPGPTLVTSAKYPETKASSRWETRAIKASP